MHSRIIAISFGIPGTQVFCLADGAAFALIKSLDRGDRVRTGLELCLSLSFYHSLAVLIKLQM